MVRIAAVVAVLTIALSACSSNDAEIRALELENATLQEQVAELESSLEAAQADLSAARKSLTDVNRVMRGCTGEMRVVVNSLTSAVAAVTDEGQTDMPETGFDATECAAAFKPGSLRAMKSGVVDARLALVEVERDREPPPPVCDPNYSGCVPVVSYDLDCDSPGVGNDIEIIGVDRHGFDGSDNDGQGCET